MFIGHFGIAFGAKKIGRRPSLGTLFFASQFIDLILPLFLLIGLEKVKIDPGNTSMTPLDFTYYPYSHSLVFVLLWGLLFGIVYYLIKRNLKISIILGLLVLSHWILDLIVHKPDLPLIPGSDIKVGFGLWNSFALSFLLEGAIFFAGIYFYITITKAKNITGRNTLWSLIIFLSIIYLMNSFGSPPPSVEAFSVVGLSQWLLVGWGYWIDRNRIVAA